MFLRRPGAAMLVVLAALAVACSASTAQRQVPSSPEQVSGCYRLELWPSESGPDVERRRAAWGSAPLLRLDTMRLTAWPSLVQRYGTVFVAFSITASGQVRDHPFNYWRFIGGDSVFVGHPGALAGASMELRRHGKELGGVISSFTDVWEEGRPLKVTAPVRAHRVECQGNGR